MFGEHVLDIVFYVNQRRGAELIFLARGEDSVMREMVTRFLHPDMRAFVKGVGWTMLATVIERGVSLVQTFVIARLLGMDNYGQLRPLVRYGRPFILNSGTSTGADGHGIGRASSPFRPWTGHSHSPPMRGDQPGHGAWRLGDIIP